MRAFSTRLFPHTVTPHRANWSTGNVPGLVPHDATDEALACNVIEVPSDADPSFYSSDALASRRIYKVSFPADPALDVNDTLSWQGLTLVVLEPAAPAAHGRLWRLSCSHTT